MINPLGMDRSDKQFLVATLIAPLLVWWMFTGRRKYGTKGMR